MRRAPRITRRFLGVLLGLAGVLLAAHWPVTTRYSVNYQRYRASISLYEKLTNFYSRHLQTRRLVRAVTSGVTGDDEKLLTIFSWVQEHVRPTPPGFPVVDDHVWNIFVRGYGAEDQRTEAFTILASYAGFPAASVDLDVPDARGRLRLYLGVVQCQGRTRVFDINHQIAFRNERGALASVDDLLRNPALVTQAAPGLTLHGVAYERYVARLGQEDIQFSRMGNQRPWFRLRSELMRLVDGRPSRDGAR